jgi:hypothetical protein
LVYSSPKLPMFNKTTINMRKTRLTIFGILLTLSLTAQESSDSIARFISSGNAYATMFFDYYYMAQGNDIYPGRSEYARNNRNDNAFSFRRVYFGYGHTFSSKFSGRVQMELTDGTMLSGGQRAFFLKEASLTWRQIYPMADLIIGHSSTPVWSVEGAEMYWRYRSIEKTIADARGLRGSSDTGLRIKGRLNEQGTLGYNFMVGNGTNARPENDRYKLIYANVWTRLLDKNLYLELYQDYNEASGNRAIYTTKGFIAWHTSRYTVATELVNQIRSGFGFNEENIDIRGLSVFAHTDILPGQLRVFGRYDSYNPDVDFRPGHYGSDMITPFDEQFFTFGLDFIPLKNIHVMPNIWVNSYKNKMDGQTTPDTEVVARLSFNVTFK